MSDLTKKGFCASTMTFYAVTYAEIRKTALEKGYALALHGSLKTDLDVIAIPWTDEACSADELAAAICETAGGMIQPETEMHKVPSLHPHGRMVWTIHLLGCSATVPPDERATYIDLGVMPRISKGEPL